MNTKLLEKMSFVVILVFLVGIFAGCGSQAPKADSAKPAASSQPTTLRFATQSLGTSLYVYASAMTQLISPVLPKGVTIDIQTTSSGGVAAPLLIAENKAEISLGNAAPAKWAVDGTLLNRPKVTGVAALAGGLDAPYLVIIFTDEFVKKTGIRTVEELVQKKYPVKVAIKAAGSFGEMAFRDVFDSLGVNYNTIKSWGGTITQTGSPQIVDMLKDGKADMTIDHLPAGQASITELTLTAKVHFIQPSDETIKKLNSKGWDSLVMPKGTWKGQDSDVKTVGSGVVLLVSNKLSDETAYAMTKKICESQKELSNAYASMSVFDPKTAWQPLKTGAPLHPGAVKYYKEKGYMK